MPPSACVACGGGARMAAPAFEADFLAGVFEIKLSMSTQGSNVRVVPGNNQARAASDGRLARRICQQTRAWQFRGAQIQSSQVRWARARAGGYARFSVQRPLDSVERYVQQVS